MSGCGKLGIAVVLRRRLRENLRAVMRTASSGAWPTRMTDVHDCSGNYIVKARLRAGRRVAARLLGTTRRASGSLQLRVQDGRSTTTWETESRVRSPVRTSPSLVAYGAWLGRRAVSSAEDV